MLGSSGPTKANGHRRVPDQTHFRAKFSMTTCDAICAGLEALLEVEALLEARGGVVEHGEVLAEGVRLTVGLAAEVVQLVVVRHLERFHSMSDAW